MVGVVLAAGMGTRLAPLTDLLPKPLCPVGNVALVDLAVDRVAAAVERVAVNVHAHRDLMLAHLAGDPEGTRLTDVVGRGGTARDVRVQVSVEEPCALGTAGALGQLRWWIDGCGVLVVNGDTWSLTELSPFVKAWDGQAVSVLLHDPVALASSRQAQLTRTSRLVATILPWREVARLDALPSGLYQTNIAPAAEAGRLVTVACGGPFFDCGSPARYLAANMASLALAGCENSLVSTGALMQGSAHRSVIGDARVLGSVDRSVVWSGAVVEEGERIERAIRTHGGTTVLIR